MLNTVLLFTPPNHGIASSTTCDHLKPIVANTVSTKSMLAHLLSTINHWFQIIRVFGHLHFRCYTTWSMSYSKFKFESGAKFYALPKKISQHWKKRCTFRFLEKTILEHLKNFNFNVSEINFSLSQGKLNIL